jgi:hypothetical protein
MKGNKILAVLLPLLFQVFLFDALSWAMPPGKVRWQYYTGSPVQTTPAVGKDGVIYVGAGNTLYALDAGGREKWTFPADGEVSSPVLGGDGSIYLRGGSKLYAVNPDGSQKWVFDGPVVRTPAVSPDGTVYIAGDNIRPGRLYALYPEDRSQKWSFEVEVIDGELAVDSNGVVYVGGWENGSGRLFALNPDKSRKWTFPTNGHVLPPPAFAPDGTVIAASDWNGTNLYAITPAGDQKWTLSTDAAAYGYPLVGADGMVYVGYVSYISYPHNNIATFRAITTSGQEAWSWGKEGFLSSPGFSSPALGRHGIVYGGINNVLYALSPPGNEKWHLSLGGNLPWTGPAVTKKGIILIGSADGYLYAITDNPNTSSMIHILLLD